MLLVGSRSSAATAARGTALILRLIVLLWTVRHRMGMRQASSSEVAASSSALAVQTLCDAVGCLRLGLLRSKVCRCISGEVAGLPTVRIRSEPSARSRLSRSDGKKGRQRAATQVLSAAADAVPQLEPAGVQCAGWGSDAATTGPAAICGRSGNCNFLSAAACLVDATATRGQGTTAASGCRRGSMCLTGSGCPDTGRRRPASQGGRQVAAQ